MIGCEEFKSALPSLKDLADRQALPEELAAHLRDCPHCSALYAALAGVEAAIAEVGQVPAAPEGYFEALPAEVLGKLAGEPAGKPERQAAGSRRVWLHPGLRFAAVAVSAVAVLGVVLFLLSQWFMLEFSAKLERSRPFMAEAETPQPAVQPKNLQVAEQAKEEVAPATRPAEQQASTKRREVIAGGSPAGRSTATETVPDRRFAVTDSANPARMRGEGQEKQPLIKAPARSSRAFEHPLQTHVEAVALSPEFRRRAAAAADVTDTTAVLLPIQIAGHKQSFAAALHFADSLPGHTAREQFWENFVATTDDSTQRALALAQLADVKLFHAREATDLLTLAAIEKWYLQNKSALEPLLGKERFEVFLDILERRRAELKQLQF